MVVLGLQDKFQCLATDRDFLAVEVFNGQAHAILIVLAGKGVGARQGAGQADHDRLFLGNSLAGKRQRQCAHQGQKCRGEFHKVS